MRISRHQAFMEVAQVFAKRSTCFRLNVGAVIVGDRNIVSVGYNGPPAGEEHCVGRLCHRDGEGCHRAVHAEENAVKRLPSEWRSKPVLLSIYVTDSPCPRCMGYILGAGIGNIYYGNLYRVNDHLSHSAASIFRVTPSGYLIDHHTGEMVDG